jgi:5-methylcytosine-specific restriction endonuclease McrA
VLARLSGDGAPWRQPGHNDQWNVRAFCQRCHINYQREHLRRRLAFLMTRALGDLFDGQY